MILDFEEQRDMLLSMINNSSFSGAAIDKVYNLKKAITEAEIKGNPDREDKD